MLAVSSITAKCIAGGAAHWVFPSLLSLLTMTPLREKKIEHKKLKVVHTVVSVAICVTLPLLKKSNYPLASDDPN